MIECNGISGVIAWASVIALFWFALDIPAFGWSFSWRRTHFLRKSLLIGAFGYLVFFYAFR